MATQTIEFAAPSGLSLASAKLCPVGSDTIQETVLTPAENTNRKTVYSAAFTDAPAGDYWLIPFLDASTPLGPQRVTLLLATGTYQTRDLLPLLVESTGAIGAAGVRSAVGLASANLDTQIAAIPTTIRLKKNTAFNGFALVMLDTSGNPATGKTVTGTVSIDGAAFASLTNAVSEIGSGAYKVNLAAADTNGNDLLLKFTATDCKTTWIKMVTQP